MVQGKPGSFRASSQINWRQSWRGTCADKEKPRRRWTASICKLHNGTFLTFSRISTGILPALGFRVRRFFGASVTWIFGIEGDCDWNCEKASEKFANCMQPKESNVQSFLVVMRTVVPDTPPARMTSHRVRKMETTCKAMIAKKCGEISRILFAETILRNNDKETAEKATKTDQPVNLHQSRWEINFKGTS